MYLNNPHYSIDIYDYLRASYRVGMSWPFAPALWEFTVKLGR